MENPEAKWLQGFFTYSIPNSKLNNKGVLFK